MGAMGLGPVQKMLLALSVPMELWLEACAGVTAESTAASRAIAHTAELYLWVQKHSATLGDRGGLCS